MEKKKDNTLLTTLLLALLALVAVSSATFAWFSISDNARSQNLRMSVTAGDAMRFDLDSHDAFDQYSQTLGFEAIATRMRSESGIDISASSLKPVTTSDGQNFTFENGAVADKSSGAYMEFTLHFMALEDTVAHLTSANSKDGNDGTSFESQTSGLSQALRMSFTADNQTWIYDPNLGATVQTSGSTRTFGLPAANAMEINDTNALFSLTKETDKAVVVRIWMEGTDSNCTNALKGADYSIRMRFEGVSG